MIMRQDELLKQQLNDMDIKYKKMLIGHFKYCEELENELYKYMEGMDIVKKTLDNLSYVNNIKQTLDTLETMGVL